MKISGISLIFVISFVTAHQTVYTLSYSYLYTIGPYSTTHIRQTSSTTKPQSRNYNDNFGNANNAGNAFDANANNGRRVESKTVYNTAEEDASGVANRNAENGFAVGGAELPSSQQEPQPQSHLQPRGQPQPQPLPQQPPQPHQQPQPLPLPLPQSQSNPQPQVPYPYAPQPAAAPASPAPSTSFNRFSTNLFQQIAPAHAAQNVIYSPISVQTLLALLYEGSEGNTAAELQRALEIPDDKSAVGYLFQNLLASQQRSPDAKLIMANKIYYNADLVLNREFSNYAGKFFDSEVEATQFGRPVMAARQINNWVANKTENRIRNLISPSTLDSDTDAILVNAIYFKAKWELPFSTSNTQKKGFYANGQRQVLVDMMFNDDNYRFADLRDLQAKAIEMPYENSDLSMLIILPDELNGLATLEQRLQNVDLNTLAQQLKPESVTLFLPKWKIEFELDMVHPLQMMGVRELFSRSAQLRSIFQGNPQVGVSQVQHKAYIEVNEAGSEAAAASFAKIVPLSLPAKAFTLNVNHPFMFAIRSPQVVYFIGHVVNF